MSDCGAPAGPPCSAFVAGCPRAVRRRLSALQDLHREAAGGLLGKPAVSAGPSEERPPFRSAGSARCSVRRRLPPSLPRPTGAHRRWRPPLRPAPPLSPRLAGLLVITVDCTYGPEPAGPRGNKERNRVRSAPAVDPQCGAVPAARPGASAERPADRPTPPHGRLLRGSFIGRCGAAGKPERCGSEHRTTRCAAHMRSQPERIPCGARAGSSCGMEALGRGGSRSGERAQGRRGPLSHCAGSEGDGPVGHGGPQRRAGGGLRAGALQCGGQQAVTADARGTAVLRSARESAAVQELREG